MKGRIIPMQTSPQAIQWRPWGEEAFREARDLSRPIFLSISAVWCHWCHVMDEESFAHPEVIRRLNGEFIPVRVDSDKRPDINNRYNMGGWPTVVVLDPDGKPLAGDTYMPAGQLLVMLASVHERPEQKTESRRDSRTGNTPLASRLDGTLVEAVSGFLEGAFDRTFGGFGGPPKFPQPWAIEFCLQQYLRQGDEKFLKMATLTLDQMRDGEIHDSVDGGFFRYATRGDWDNPHYEKLLETNVRLLSIYLDAYHLTGLSVYQATAEGIMEYLFTTLAAPGQPWFYGSQSASTDYYTLPEELRIETEAPALDPTLYADRNATTVSALLKAAQILKESHFQEAALKLIDFLWVRFYHQGRGMYHFDDGVLS
ncbi:MAG: thioredoxin domain-containing protein, partial [Nitrospirae bacterium]|nr:thioredoxin domain-containing protein [Nitrospirota bacterium]